MQAERLTLLAAAQRQIQIQHHTSSSSPQPLDMGAKCMMMTNTMMEPGIPARYSYSASETRDSMGMSLGTTHHPLNLHHQRQPNGSSYPPSNGPGSEFGSGNIVYQTPTSAPIPVPSANKRAHTPVPASVLGFEASTFRHRFRYRP